jgi:rod shape-determining protein MreC
VGLATEDRDNWVLATGNWVLFFMDVLGRYRNLIILVGVLFLQVLGLAMQVKRSGDETTQDTRLIRLWAASALSPFERALVWVQSGTGNVWHNYFYLRGVRAENRDLKAQIEQMRLEQVRLNEDAAQARRLQTLLAFKEQFISKTVAAQVIGSSGSDLSRVVYIDKGENVGIQRDMAVITANGIVGKVLQAYPSESQVLLISDQSSGVGAILEKTRLQGVLRGTSNGQIVLERVMADEQVTPGETVLTSGGDQIFPKGLPVGTVMQVDKGKDLFLNIKIKPATSLSRLEEVLVLVEKQQRPSLADEKTRVRAADILAQRLPSVPDKPVADAKSVGVTTQGNANAASVTIAPKPKIEAPADGQPVSKPKTANSAANSSADTTAAPKQKLDSAPAIASKPALSEPKPAITDQRAATQPATSPNPQPRADDNGPH